MVVSSNGKHNNNQIDRKEFEKFRDVIPFPCEMRILAKHDRYPKPDTLSGWYDNPDDFWNCLEATNIEPRNVYFTINPVDPGLLSRRCNKVPTKLNECTGDAHITRLVNLVIDIDPVRVSGIPSTKAEHNEAIIRSCQIMRDLMELGWPDPIQCDSGNGAYLFFAIDLDVSDAPLVANFLAALSGRYTDDKVSIDTSVFNPSRIMRVMGTKNQKGEDLPHRPHRMSRVLARSEFSREIVSREMLVDYIAANPITSATKPDTGLVATLGRLEGMGGGTEKASWLLEFFAKHEIEYRAKGNKGTWQRFGVTCPFCGNTDSDVMVNPEGALTFHCFHQTAAKCATTKKWNDYRKHYEPTPVVPAAAPTSSIIGPYRFEPKNSAEFAAQPFKHEWLVKGLLVREQPVLFGGPAKAMKTNLLVDLAASLGSATLFLGKWPCRQHNVAVISGESGGFTIQDCARRITSLRGVKMADLSVWWDFRLPRLSIADELDELASGLAKRGIEVCMIDPLYLCLLAGAADKQASNVFDMGGVLGQVAYACQQVGAQPILTHHCIKHVNFRPLDLGDLAFSGMSEFARQWLLVSRRKEYEGNGFHQLWLKAGGGIGFGGLWGIDIDEGRATANEDPDSWEVVTTTKEWEVDVFTADEVKARDNAAKTSKKEANDEGECDYLTNLLLTLSDQPTRNKLWRLTNWYVGKFDRIFGRMISDGRLRLITDDAGREVVALGSPER